MDTKTFNRVFEEQVKLSRDVLVAKGKEYSTEDKLHNFKTASALQQCTQAQALSGMMAKHSVSIYDMLASGEEYDMAIWDEKLTDHINYLFLLKAILVEESTTS